MSFMFLVLPYGAFAESEFSFRVMPVLNVPFGVKNFSLGFGGSAALDWKFLSLSRNIGAGLTAGGAFSRLGIADGSAFITAEGLFGPFVQWRTIDRLSLRGDINAGVYNYSHNDLQATKFTAGTGLSVFFHLNPSIALFASASYSYYIFSQAQPLNTVKAGLGISLNLSEIMRPQTRVAGQKTEQGQVFPVSFAWYEKNSFAVVKITNNEPNAISGVSASFYLERYMNQPTVFAELPRLAPGESAELPVTALFNESMLDMTENMNANALVTVNYRSLGSPKQASFPVQMPLYHRNAMSWDDDRRAASFVSGRDPAAVLFARYIASLVQNRIKENPGMYSRLPENVLYALALFEALNVYGINYMIDPASSYKEMSENASSLDSLNYPYQTLAYHGGDCDDLSILYCSLLEVLNIETAFITVPGHIYMAFDSGVEDSSRLIPDTSLYIAQGDKLWVPVEITIPGAGFAQAVRTGAREWERTDEGALYPMTGSWQLYPPVSVPGAGERLPALPAEAALVKAIDDSVARFTN